MRRSPDMKALVVRYDREINTSSVGPGMELITKISHTYLPDLTRRIERGEVNEVILCGPGVCTGWRIGVKRGVRFVERPTVHEQDAIAQNQARMRIMDTR
jgi:hypothetical protein